MRKRVIVSFITDDPDPRMDQITQETKSLIGNFLRDNGFTHTVIFPGIDAAEGQEFVVNFPPVWIDTSDYNNWENKE